MSQKQGAMGTCQYPKTKAEPEDKAQGRVKVQSISQHQRIAKAAETRLKSGRSCCLSKAPLEEEAISPFPLSLVHFRCKNLRGTDLPKLSLYVCSNVPY